MFFLFLWAALGAARLFYFTVLARNDYLEAGERLSIRTGVIPAMRGRIVNKDGTLLAWSERIVDILLTEIPDSAFRRERIECEVRRVLPNFSISLSRKGMIIKKDISPEEQIALFPIVSKFREIVFIRRVERRRCCGVPPELIGSVRVTEGGSMGVSGYEKRFDGKLRGRSGVFQVMVDRRGRWIPGTWREMTKPVNGEDVSLTVYVKSP
jgi:cell division protein FtsI/penicillin-binding protein 2